MCKHQDIENNYHKKYIFEIVCQGKMFFSPEHKKKLQVLHIVLDFTSSTSIKHVLAYFQGNTEIQGLALYLQFTNSIGELKMLEILERQCGV